MGLKISGDQRLREWRFPKFQFLGSSFRAFRGLPIREIGFGRDLDRDAYQIRSRARQWCSRLMSKSEDGRSEELGVMHPLICLRGCGVQETEGWETRMVLGLDLFSLMREMTP